MTTTRKKMSPTSLTLHLDLAQAEQFRNLCTILNEEPIDLARRLFLDALQKGTLQVLKSMARRSLVQEGSTDVSGGQNGNIN